MRIFVNAKTNELCESVKQALCGASAELEFELCSDDEKAAAADYSAADVIIVSLPLRSEFGLNYVAETAKKTQSPIVVLARADIAEDVQSRIRFTGAFVLAKPFSKGVLLQTIHMAQIAKENINRLEQEKTALQGQLDDAKIINRAKCCLIQYLNMTEQQAHKHMQKLAMDTRRTQRQIAEDILKTYSI